MNSAAAIIEALNSRTGDGSRLREAARASWRHWLDRLAERPGRVTGPTADALVDQLAARPVASAPPRDALLNRWQAFATLWRQQWQPASSDERSWRWTAGATSFFWHVLMAILLLIVAALRFTDRPPAPDDQAVLVEYVGNGTPAESGGGPAPAPAPSVQAESPSAAAAASAAPSTSSARAPAAQTPAPDVTQARPDAPAQPLTVTTPVSPEVPDFVLPPTSPLGTVVNTTHQPVPAVREVDIPEPPHAPTVAVPSPEIAVLPSSATPSVAVRDVPTAPQLPMSSVPSPAVEVTRTPSAAPSVAERAIPSKSTAPAAASASPSSATSAARPSTATSAAAGPTSAQPSTGVGVGPRAQPAPGSWATARRADDWGDSNRNRPGNGLFDGNGRPHIGDAPGSASPGMPPGMITEEIKDLDRAGTWLRRKPYPYEPTRFDRFWIPNETLVQEWVRRGYKEVAIPIPGGNKHIVCGISILQLGGGCTIVDPNLVDQPASARPPPDVPFKPSLQGGNGATWDPETGKPASPPPLPGLFAPPASGVPPGSLPPKPAGG